MSAIEAIPVHSEDKPTVGRSTNFWPEHHVRTRIVLCLLAGVSLSFMRSASWAAESSGQTLYVEYCAVCHGERGDGSSRAQQSMNPPPRNFAVPGAASALDRTRMLDAVRNGKQGTAMVAWGTRLSEAEIESVVDFIRSRFMATALTDAPVADLPRTDVVKQGRQIYERTCSVCHGDRGEGAVWGRSALKPPPRDFTTDAAVRELSRERMVASVTHGRPGTAMAGFANQLSSAQIEAVVVYVRSELMRSEGALSKTAPARDGNDAGHSSPQERSTLAPQRMFRLSRWHSLERIQGDPRSGQDLYLRNCVACHGANGEGDGPRAYFISPRPRNFRHAASRTTLDRASLFEGIRRGVVGREMPAWGKVLGDQQIADVAEYVYRTFIRAEPATSSQRQ